MKKLRSLLAALWDSLFDINQHPARYLGRALLLDLPIALPVAMGVGLAFPDLGPDFSRLPPGLLLPMVCLVGPAIETLLMGLIFFLLRRVMHQTVPLVMASTLCWVVLHSLGAPAHGLGIFWPFLIFSICYLSWEKRSWKHAFGMTWLLHALHNLLPGIVLLIDLLR